MPFNFITFASAVEDQTPGYMTAETLSTGVSTTVIGMVVVFLVLIILYLFVKFLGSAMSSIENGTAKKKAAPAPAPAAASLPEAAPASEGLSAKKVAAIMAAVSSASGKPLAQLRFRSVRRAASTASTGWSASGTAEIINTRQQYL